MSKTANKCVRMTKRNGIWASEDDNVQIAWVNDAGFENIWVALCGFMVYERPVMLGAGTETDMLACVRDAYSDSMGRNILLRLYDEEDVEIVTTDV